VKRVVLAVGFFVLLLMVGYCIDESEKRKETQAARVAREAKAAAARPEKERLAAMSPEERARLAEAEKKRKQEAAEARARAERTRLGLTWIYTTSTDDLSGKPVSIASIRSTNTVSFGFPYQGEQRATLTLRKHPRWGESAYLKIERGQFICRLDDCDLRVVFDSGAVQRFTGSRPSDGSADLVFIRNRPRFVSQLQRARSVRIAAEFYQEGERTFSFDVEGLR
jgi:hypothetical protein